MRSLLALTLVALVPLTAPAQGKKKAEEKPLLVVDLKRSDTVAYEKEVEPILLKRCVACHSGPVKESRFDISTYESLVKGGKRGVAVVPGKADSSLLYKSIMRTHKPYMPPQGEGDITPKEAATIKLWIDQGAKAPTGIRVKEKIIVGLPPANVTPVRAVAVSHDKSMVASGRSNQIHIYDAGSGTYIRSFYDPDAKTPDGKVVKAAHLSLVESLAFSPDGKFLASGSFQEVSLWDVQTGKLRKKLTGFAHMVVAVAFSADGKFFATGGGAPTEDGEVKVYEADTWKLVTEIKNGHSDTVYGLCFSPDHKKIATASADKFVKVWELPSGKFIKSFEGHTHHVLDVGWMADGKLLASAGADNTVKVWDYEKGEQARTIKNVHSKQVTRLMFIGKTSQVVTCSGDATVKFVNVQSGGVTRNFAGNTDFVYAVSVSPDGAIVAAGGEEGVVRVYNGTNGQMLRTLVPPGEKK